MVQIRRMGPQIGVEVSGVDVRTLDDAGFAPIYQAWLDYNVLVVKGQDLTISFSGGGLGGTLTRDLVLDDRDKVKVLNSSAEDLKVRIDRKSGRFQAKVTIDTAGTRIKATGVLIQATSGGTGGRGTGTFDTDKGSGTVTISAGGSGGSTTPAPNPVAP